MVNGLLKLPDVINALEAEDKKDFHAHVEEVRMKFGKSMLTAREYEILQLMLTGKSNKSISKLLNISDGTNKVHRKNIYAKMGVNSHVELYASLLDAISAHSTNAELDRS